MTTRLPILRAILLPISVIRVFTSFIISRERVAWNYIIGLILFLIVNYKIFQ